MSPQRIQRKRSKGWRMPEGVVYVGRPGRWGNPWSTSTRYESDTWRVRTAAEAVERYTDAIRRNDAGDRFHRECPTSEQIRADLAGRDLACWCPLDQPCHADVLLRIANGAES